MPAAILARSSVFFTHATLDFFLKTWSQLLIKIRVRVKVRVRVRDHRRILYFYSNMHRKTVTHINSFILWNMIKNGVTVTIKETLGLKIKL